MTQREVQNTRTNIRQMQTDCGHSANELACGLFMHVCKCGCINIVTLGCPKEEKQSGPKQRHTIKWSIRFEQLSTWHVSKLFEVIHARAATQTGRAGIIQADKLGALPQRGCHVWPGASWFSGPRYTGRVNNYSLAASHMAVGQKQWYHFGVGAPPILVYFTGDWDVHWGYGILTHGHMRKSKHFLKGAGNEAKDSWPPLNHDRSLTVRRLMRLEQASGSYSVAETSCNKLKIRDTATSVNYSSREDRIRAPFFL